MANGLIELFKDFHSQAVEGEYPAAVRALYNFFLGELNVRFWQTDELSYSVRELATLVGLSKSTVYDAVKFLCDRGYIKTSRNKVKTKTFFKILTVQSTLGRLWADAGQIVGSLDCPNYAHAEDFKDSKDVKTKNQNDKRARAIPKIKDTPVEEIDSEVRHAWILANGENPFGGYAEDLLGLQKSYGAKKVADAITSCRRKRTFGDMVSINFVKAELLRGGESSGGKIIQLRQSANNDADFQHDDYAGAWNYNDELPPDDDSGEVAEEKRGHS